MFNREKPNLENIIQAAQKKVQADIVFKNGYVINVFTCEIYKADVAVVSGVIAAVGDGYAGKDTVDVEGKFISPGFLDGHLHVESSMSPIPEFARNILPHGTTTIVIDPHEIANIMGTTGISYMLKTSKYNPLNVYMMLPSCVPATAMETAGAELKAVDLLMMLQDRWVLGLGEMMNFPGLLNLHEDVLDKIKISEGKIIDGHAPGLTGPALNAYVAAGMRSDHECTNPQEAMEKLRLGMYLMIREGSSTKNLIALLPVVNADTLDRCFFVTDDCSPAELMDEGHIDRMIRIAIANGIKPTWAIRMATINTARYFGLRSIGAIAPGYDADLVILDDLEKISINSVYKNGIQITDRNHTIYPFVDNTKMQMRSSVNVRWIEKEHIKIPIKSNKFRVIEVVPDQIVTRELVYDNPKQQDGLLQSDIERDLLKLVVIERHFGSGRTGLGVIKGFGLKKGAVASTIAHDSHNIIAVGVDDDDIYEAVVQLVRQQGGIAFSVNKEIVHSLPLPIGGLMSDLPLPEIREKLDQIVESMHQLGCGLKHPIMSLSFMSLPVIPEIKLTDNGLFNIKTFSHVDLFIE